MGMFADPIVTDSITVEHETGCGSVYVVLRFGDDGKLIGVLGRLGKAGGCSALNTEVTCSLITEAIRAGADPKQLVKCLRGTLCHRANQQAGLLSCADAFSKALERGLEVQDERMAGNSNSAGDG